MLLSSIFQGQSNADMQAQERGGAVVFLGAGTAVGLPIVHALATAATGSKLGRVPYDALRMACSFDVQMTPCYPKMVPLATQKEFGPILKTCPPKTERCTCAKNQQCSNALWQVRC